MESLERVLTYPTCSLTLLRATELAALAAARGAGREDPETLRQRATAAIGRTLDESGLQVAADLGVRQGTAEWADLLIGESEVPAWYLAAYPAEGATLAGGGGGGAISVLYAAAPDGVPQLPPVRYMEKIVAGPSGRDALDLDDDIGDNLRRLAFARDARIGDLLIAVLDRPRHQDLVRDIRAAGARVILFEEGEVSGALLAATGTGGVDAMVGIGGLQETVVEAGLARCLGGEITAKLWARNDEERALAGAALERTFGLADLAPGPVEAAITGITDGLLLHGPRLGHPGDETESIVLSSVTGTARRITTRHHRA
ncbi:MAG: fructose-bisphosphatase class II [Candidatus Dormibacteraceae bacterium]